MAYVDSFEHDIFLSYARVDDQTVGESERGWVSTFEKHLQVALDRRAGRIGAVKIWRDLRRIDGNQLFDRTIEVALDATAVFVALTSNGYLASDYCRQELAWFRDRAAADPIGLTAGDRLRIINVLLTNVDRERWPEEYDRTRGFPFHDAERDDDRGVPSEPDSPEFKRQLRELADALYELLEAMKPASGSRARKDAGTVFLADVPRQLSGQKRRLAESLERHGLEIVSGVPPPFEEASHDYRVIEALEKADLSVHLLDAHAGQGIDGRQGLTYPQHQVELALEHAAARTFWIPRGLEFDAITDKPHQDFLRELERGREGSGSYDFVRGVRAELRDLVVEKVKDLRRRSGAGSGGERSCLLVTHDKDTKHVWPVAMAIQKQGIRPFVNQLADEPKAVLELFEERLKGVARLIVFYGAVSRVWVEKRIEAAAKLAVMQGRLHDLELAVFDAPPEKSPEDLRFGGLIQVRMLSNASEALEFVR